MIQGVAFDLDDTLYPEEAFVMSGYRAVSKSVEAEHGVAVFDDLAALFRTGRRGDLFTPVLRRRLGAVDEAYVKTLVEVYRGHRPRIEPFLGAEETLRDLATDFRIGLISDGIAEVQDRKLAALGLRGYFDAVVFSGAFGREFWKPHPRPYRACAGRLGLPPSRMLYVGDNPAKDFVTARELGMATIRVRRPGTLHHAVNAARGYEADVTVGDIAEIPGTVRSLAQARPLERGAQTA